MSGLDDGQRSLSAPGAFWQISGSPLEHEERMVLTKCQPNCKTVAICRPHLCASDGHLSVCLSSRPLLLLNCKPCYKYVDCFVWEYLHDL